MSEDLARCDDMESRCGQRCNFVYISYSVVTHSPSFSNITCFKHKTEACMFCTTCSFKSKSYRAFWCRTICEGVQMWKSCIARGATSRVGWALATFLLLWRLRRRRDNPRGNDIRTVRMSPRRPFLAARTGACRLRPGQVRCSRRMFPMTQGIWCYADSIRCCASVIRVRVYRVRCGDDVLHVCRPYLCVSSVLWR